MTSRQQRRAQQRLAQKEATRHPQTATSTPQVASRTQIDYTAQIESATRAHLFTDEEAADYRTHLRLIFDHHTPEPGLECCLVQRLADLQWRIRRIAPLEAGFVALFRRKYADLFPEAEGAVRTALIDAHAYVAEGLAFKRLATREMQLRRFYAKDLAELAAMQQSRLTTEGATQDTLPVPAPNGFEFSMSDAELEIGFEFSKLPDRMAASSAIQSPQNFR